MWHQIYSSQLAIPPFIALEQLFNLTDWVTWPNANGLNRLAAQLGDKQLPEFVDQSKLQGTDLYYEQIIAQQGRVPARSENWHDLFNALIWCQFPASKQLLNQLHIEQVSRYGLSPRTSVRDRITHFDECGLVLAYSDSSIPVLLGEHQWQQAFLYNRSNWGNKIQAFVFGHAILEMLLNPYIGLTGKWLGIQVKERFFDWSYEQQNRFLDQALLEKISAESIFQHPKPTKPLPILGIPDWHHERQDADFYTNTDYFMPKRSRKAAKCSK